MDLIEHHRAHGRRVVIVSASPEEIVVPLGRHLGITETIASRAAIDEDGRYTGEMEFYAYGEHKAEAIRELAAATASISSAPMPTATRSTTRRCSKPSDTRSRSTPIASLRALARRTRLGGAALRAAGAPARIGCAITSVHVARDAGQRHRGGRSQSSLRDGRSMLSAWSHRIRAREARLGLVFAGKVARRG